MSRDRTPPPTPEAAAMRAAGDLLGAEKLADQLGMASRTIYALMAGKRTVKPGVLADTRQLLIEHRQKTGKLIEAIRAVEDGRIQAAEASDEVEG